jgi:lysylphosphatidylglycerol synthetase-like protein (DUF2156 family)
MNQQLIERYVAGKMSEAEAEAFEESCVANPDLARQVEFEQRLKAGLVLVASGSTAEFVRSESPWRWMLPLAASVLIFITAGAYLWQQITASQILAAVATQAQRDGTSMRLALVRGSDGMPHLPPGKVRVEIVGLFDPGYHYTVALDYVDQQRGIVTVATIYGQHPSSPVTLEVMVNSDQLDPGSYFLRVSKQARDEEALDFSFVKS